MADVQEEMPVSEKESRPRMLQAPGPRLSEAWQGFLRWRKFTWLPGEIEITVSGKEREKRTAERDEGRQDVKA